MFRFIEAYGIFVDVRCRCGKNRELGFITMFQNMCFQNLGLRAPTLVGREDHRRRNKIGTKNGIPAVVKVQLVPPVGKVNRAGAIQGL